MDKQAFTSVLLKFIKNVLLVITAAAAIALALGLIRPPLTIQRIGSTLMNLGFVLLVAGTLTVIGNWVGARQFSYQYAQSAGDQDSLTRAQRMIMEILKTYRFLALFGISGIILMILGGMLWSM